MESIYIQSDIYYPQNLIICGTQLFTVLGAKIWYAQLI